MERLFNAERELAKNRCRMGVSSEAKGTGTRSDAEGIHPEIGGCGHIERRLHPERECCESCRFWEWLTEVLKRVESKNESRGTPVFNEATEEIEFLP